MAKSIIIQEGGIGKQLTADKLKTNLVGGGTCLWVPEDETRLGVKHITEDGTYKASEEGYYGYSEVTVNGIGTVTGRDPDTGEEVEVRRDPDTGDIVSSVIPTEIRIVTPPTKTEYRAGEAINMAGAVIKAYSSTGRELQVVPLNEISINPTSAPSAGEPSYAYDASMLENTYVKNPLSFVRSVTYEAGTPPNNVFNVSASSGYFLTIPSGYFWVSDTSASIVTTGFDDYQQTTFVDAATAVIDGQQVSIAGTALASGGINVQNPTYPQYPSGNATLRDMYRLIYMGYGTSTGGSSPVTVSWTNSSGTVLETSFNITVT